METGVLNLIGNGKSIRESRDVPSNLVEGQSKVVDDCSPGELLLWLLSENDNLALLSNSFSLSDIVSGNLGDGRVDSSTKSTIGRDGDVKDLLDLGLRLGGVGLNEDSVVGISV